MIRYLSFYVPSRGTLVYVTLVLMVHPNDIVFSHYYPDSCRGPLPGVTCCLWILADFTRGRPKR